MKNTIFYLIILNTLLITSCAQNAKNYSNSKNSEDEQKSELQSDNNSFEISDENADRLSADIDMMREGIEYRLDSSVRVATAGLKDKIRQNLESLDYFFSNGEMMKIRTVPYSNKSEKYEVYYVMNGQLNLCLVTENENSNTDSINEGDVYYFQFGEPFKHVNINKESTYSTKDDKALELQQKVQEYYAHFVKMK